MTFVFIGPLHCHPLHQAQRDQPCSATFISDSQTEGKDEVSGVRCSIINNRHGNNVDLPPALFRRAVFSRHRGQQGVGRYIILVPGDQHPYFCRVQHPVREKDCQHFQREVSADIPGGLLYCQPRQQVQLT